MLGPTVLDSIIEERERERERADTCSIQNGPPRYEKICLIEMIIVMTKGINSESFRDELYDDSIPDKQIEVHHSKFHHFRFMF